MHVMVVTLWGMMGMVVHFVATSLTQRNCQVSIVMLHGLC